MIISTTPTLKNGAKTLVKIERLGIKLSKEDNEVAGKEKMKVVMQKWLPSGEAMVQIIVLHLSLPVQAQKYMAEILYEGPMDDPAAQGMSQNSKTFRVLLNVFSYQQG